MVAFFSDIFVDLTSRGINLFTNLFAPIQYTIIHAVTSLLHKISYFGWLQSE